MRGRPTLFFISMLLLATVAGAQTSITLPPDGENQHATVTQYLGLVKVTIDYHSPKVHNPRGGVILGLPEQMDERQRHLALAQIAANRLADGTRVAREIEEVVHQLEHDAEIEPVLAQFQLTRLADAAQHAADLRAPAKQKRGFWSKLFGRKQ